MCHSRVAHGISPYSAHMCGYVHACLYTCIHPSVCVCGLLLDDPDSFDEHQFDVSYKVLGMVSLWSDEVLDLGVKDARDIECHFHFNLSRKPNTRLLRWAFVPRFSDYLVSFLSLSVYCSF